MEQICSQDIVEEGEGREELLELEYNATNKSRCIVECSVDLLIQERIA
jgi:hypothetical protein